MTSAKGHIQFDIRLGPAFDAKKSSVVVYYGSLESNCPSAALKGLSPQAFTHVSLPLSGFAGCDRTQAVSYMSIVTDQRGWNAGVMYYVDDVRWTPD